MSVWLTLIKLDPALLPATPSFLESLFFDSPASKGINPDEDVLGIDNFDDLVDLADPSSPHPWIARATRGTGTAQIDCGLRYWGAFVHDPAAVAQIAANLPNSIELALEAAEDFEFDQDFDDVRAFYRRAAREGRAVVGGAH
ncbi:hypothetical protein ABZS66_08225 [Dactylosporangium sp. NPDC005572]|uniref:hypothetical protein n=1 Tax=Dactylosporangium sp. NPDC005572 TaxID=3156889 RepID=UPI0033BDBDFA